MFLGFPACEFRILSVHAVDDLDRTHLLCSPLAVVLTLVTACEEGRRVSSIRKTATKLEMRIKSATYASFVDKMVEQCRIR